MRTLAILLLLVVVAAASWYAATSLGKQDWESKVDDLKSELGSLQEQIEAIEPALPDAGSEDETETVPTLAETRAAIIQFSQELIPICDSPNPDSIMLLYLRSHILGPRIFYTEPMKTWQVGQIQERTILSSQLSGLATELTGLACIPEMKPVMDAFIAGLHENRQMVDSIDVRWTEDIGGLPGMIHVYSEEEEQAIYAQSSRCLAHLAEAERLYDSACELWQSILDEYNISFSDIGLTERLLKPQPEQMDFCGQ